MNAPTPYYDGGGITLYHGDNREVLPALGVEVDAWLLDPPFKLSQTYTAAPDADNLDAVASLQDTARLMLGCSRPGAVAVIWYDNRIMPFGLDAMRRAGWQYLRTLACYRRWGQAHQLSGWMSTLDPLLVFAAPGAAPTFYGPWRHDTYIKDGPEAESTGHPAQKPVGHLAHIVGNITPPEGLVVDCYSGSGSTLLAARQAGRRVIGIEREETSCALTIRRLQGMPVRPGSQEALDFGADESTPDT